MSVRFFVAVAGDERRRRRPSVLWRTVRLWTRAPPGITARVRHLIAALLLVALSLPLAACGEGREDNAVEAMERNAFELGGLRYRVAMFRQLNPRIPPDRALYDGRLEGRVGLFAAFLIACNESGEPRRPTAAVQLEDAFGEVYPRVARLDDNPLLYSPEPIQPGGCLPVRDGTADRTLPGAAVLFEVPFDALGNRPFVLELRDSESGRAAVERVQLDL